MPHNTIHDPPNDVELAALAARTFAAVPGSTWDDAFGVLVDLEVPVAGPIEGWAAA